MYLSCLLIEVGENPDRPRPGRTWLSRPYRVHQRLSMAFPSHELKTDDPSFLKPFDTGGFQHVHARRTNQEAFLFRIDPLLGGRAMVVVQSATEPDWDYAFQNASHLLAAIPEVKPFAPRFEALQKMQFRLRANPTRRDKSTGKRQGILTQEKQEDWLRRKGELGGFVPLSTEVVAEHFRRQTLTGQNDAETRLSHFSVKYEGVLQVTDPEAFLRSIITGIGSAKGFGFGLLSVAPLRGG